MELSGNSMQLVELQVHLLWCEAVSVWLQLMLIYEWCFLFLLQEVKERDPEWIKFKVRCRHGIQWAQSICSVILEPVLLRIFLSMSLLMMTLCSSQLTRLS